MNTDKFVFCIYLFWLKARLVEEACAVTRWRQRNQNASFRSDQCCGFQFLVFRFDDNEVILRCSQEGWAIMCNWGLPKGCLSLRAQEPRLWILQLYTPWWLIYAHSDWKSSKIGAMGGNRQFRSIVTGTFIGSFHKVGKVGYWVASGEKKFDNLCFNSPKQVLIVHLGH